MDDAQRISAARKFMYSNYDTKVVDLLPELSKILDIPNNDECHKFCIGIFIQTRSDSLGELLKIRNSYPMPQSTPTLQELAFMYGTDKLEHSYIPFYEQHLPKDPKKILEIGVKEGKSIQMWMKYFPNAEIHGLDLFKEFPVPFNDPQVTWHEGNQCDWELLEKLRNENFDVIIDDGSHNARQQMITFFGLFNGKHYFIEDIHCNEDPFYSEGIPFQFSAKGLFKKIFPRGYADDFTEINIEGNIILIKCS